MKLIKVRFFCFILVFLTAIFANAQEYKFIEKCTKLVKRIKPDNLEFISKLYRGQNSGQIYMTEFDGTFKIQDRTNNVRQSFTIDYQSDTLQMKNFLKNPIIAYQPERIIKKITVEKIAENKFSVKTYEKLNSRKTNLEIIFTLKKSEYALTQYHFLDLSIIIQDQIYKALLKELKEDTNYQIEYIDLDYRTGYTFLYRIKDCEKVNWAISIK